MILEVLTPSRKRRKPGEIFAFKPKRHGYFFGLVVRTDANCGFGPEANLIYLYNAESSSKEQIPYLNKNRLLIEVCFINNLPWSKGYFETVDIRDIEKIDIFERHIFYGFLSSPSGFIDEFCNYVEGTRDDAVGHASLSSYRSIDAEIGFALGYSDSETG